MLVKIASHLIWCFSKLSEYQRLVKTQMPGAQRFNARQEDCISNRLMGDTTVKDLGLILSTIV